jgi:hypothetical protein
MDSVELLLAMVLAVIASGYLVRVLPFSNPLPLAQIALGALIAPRDCFTTLFWLPHS